MSLRSLGNCRGLWSVAFSSLSVQLLVSQSGRAKGQLDFSINILAPSVGSLIKSYHKNSNHQRSSERIVIDVTRSSALGGDNETSEIITLREIANKTRERVMQE